MNMAKLIEMAQQFDPEEDASVLITEADIHNNERDGSVIAALVAGVAGIIFEPENMMLLDIVSAYIEELPEEQAKEAIQFGLSVVLDADFDIRPALLSHLDIDVQLDTDEEIADRADRYKTVASIISAGSESWMIEQINHNQMIDDIFSNDN